MADIQIFEPDLWYGCDICGMEVEGQQFGFSVDLDWAEQNGIQFERFKLGQQPMAFDERSVVKKFLERSGSDALPLTLVDGEVGLAGRYPTRAELIRWASIATPVSAVEA